jgi:hypothetical protein
MPNPENIVKHQFKKGQSGNPKGAPPKAIAQINKELIKRGYKVPSKRDILDAGLLMLSMPVEEIDLIAMGKGDKKLFPSYYPVVAQRILSEDGSDFIEKILDRALGKATQNTDVTTKGEKIQSQFIVGSKDLSDEVKGFINGLEED